MQSFEIIFTRATFGRRGKKLCTNSRQYLSQEVRETVMAHNQKIIDSPIRQKLLSKFISLDKSVLHRCVTAAFTELNTFSSIWVNLQPPVSVKS